MDAVTVRHPKTGRTSVVPASSLARHVAAGWERVEKATEEHVKRPKKTAADPADPDTADAATPESES